MSFASDSVFKSWYLCKCVCVTITGFAFFLKNSVDPARYRQHWLIRPNNAPCRVLTALLGAHRRSMQHFFFTFFSHLFSIPFLLFFVLFIVMYMFFFFCFLFPYL